MLSSALSSPIARPEVAERIGKASRILLFLDFDGTLAPIVSTPEVARASVEMLDLLSALAARKDFLISIVSGRMVDDVREKVNLPDIVYSGDHGLEIDGPGIRFRAPGAEAAEPALRDLLRTLAPRLQQMPGVWVENKGLTATVHYRLRPEAREAVRAAVRAAAGDFLVRDGKMAVEILPRVSWDKGRAVKAIRETLGLPGDLAIAIGDDATDEDMFAALPDGLTVRVGSGIATRAGYAVASPDEVQEFLRWVGSLHF